MKGVILAGGTGSRLFPLTKVTNKHLLPVGRKPMIYWPIEKLLEAGITEILIVTGVEHMGAVVNLLGSGQGFKCRFTYKVQDEAGGIAQALGLAENFAAGDRLCVILGDNIFRDSIKTAAADFARQAKGAKVMLKKVADPRRYGVVRFQGDQVREILEKPRKPPSPWCVTGIYFYDRQVFSIIRKIKFSARGEMEITDVNNAYIKKGEMTFGKLKGWWTDAGTFDSIQTATQLASRLSP